VNVLLDLWGVLLDSDRMQREYGRELARRMVARFGGTEDRWLLAHTAAWTEYVRGTEAADWGGRPWSETVDRLDAAFAIGVLERMGVSWRPPDSVAFAHELDLGVMSGIDARFPDARTAVERLRSAGHRVFVATQATESNARGALTGAGLLDSVDGIFTGTSQNASKSRSPYWARARATLGGAALPGVAVDDRADYLAAAASAGFVALLLDREAVYEGETMPHHVRAMLRNLAGLPHFVEVLEAEARRTST
jgi:phosphoglycolate phosphatase-like HAD superfamily hydrolase